MRIGAALAVIALLLSGFETAQAGNILTWDPTNGLNWSTSGNWSPEGIPDSGTTVVLNSGTALMGSLAGSTAISSLQNSGSSSANLYIQSGASLTVTNGITATGNLTLFVDGDTAPATLTLGGSSTLAGTLNVSSASNGAGSLNLQTGASASIQTLVIAANTGFEAVATVENGAVLNMNGLATDSGGILTVNGTGTATATNGFNLAGGQVGLNLGGTLSLAGSQDVGQAYNGGPELSGGYISSGAYVAAGAGNGTLNLGSDVAMGASGTLASGSSASSNLTVNNTAGRSIYIEGGNIGTSGGINQVIMTGNMNFVGTTINGGPGGVVLEGTNNFIGGTTWSNYVNLANGSVTTVSQGINQGSGATIVNLLGNAQLIVNNGGFPGRAAISGTYNVAQGASLTMQDAYLETGSVVNTSGNFYVPDGYTQSAGTTEVNGLMDAGSNTVSITGGTFQGSGTIDASDVSVTGGTIKPGDSPGIMTINGNLTLGSNATTLIQYGGTDNSDPGNAQYDAFVVNGTAFLNGYLDTEYMDLGIGYNPAVGDEFTFMTCTVACTGTFSGLYDWVSSDEYFKLIYNSNSVELEVMSGTPTSPAPTSAAPEPGTWFLLASGLAATLIGRNRATRLR